MSNTGLNKTLEKLLKSYDEHCKSVAQATHIDINQTPAERRKFIKELEKDYANWFSELFPQYAKSECAWFHKKLAKLLIENDICNLLAEIYRSGAKSVHLCMGIPLYLYVTGKLKFMLLIGQTEPKAKKLISDIQAQLTHNRRFIHYYGKKFKFGDWAAGDFTTTDGAKFMAMGIGQSPRGLREGEQRPDYIAVDDVDTKERCNNEARSKKAAEWVWEDLKGTFDEGSKHQRFVVANNNFHKNTVINQLKKDFNTNNQKAKEHGFRSNHFIITVKAVKNLTTFEPEWKEKTSAAYWKQKYHSTPYRSFMREYMHVHIIEGSIFKNEQIQYKKRLQYRQYDALCLYGDLSYKNAGDFKALILAGKSKREFHILDCYVRQTSRNNAALWLYEKVESDNLLKYNISYWIEALFAQDEFVSDFNIVGDEKGWYIPVVPDKIRKSAKFDRIESMSGYFERGNVWFNTAIEASTDCQELINQLLAFQKGSGAHDDAPDALQGAISKLNTAANINAHPPKTTSRKEINKSKKNKW
ncbi:phage terminase large subunit [Tenacibaculum maritimum]|uniref:phage terminase large subunit n=1 Tax=Tenacibaculum maritimum TaxID=107401 RepID=UPI0012E6E6BB|nr:phage terminase large subunit [Tenacibaculum maritimum]CAA0158726.1 conserved hypothetical protein [Tenacibaculum maritimum]